MTTQEWGTRGVSARPWERTTGVGGPDHALALELVPVTEAAALAAGRWVGRGDKNGGRAAAVDAMYQLLGTVPMRGVAVIGEGEKRDTPVLFRSAAIGDGSGPACDVAISAGDGALSAARDVPYALSAIAVAERGALHDPSPFLAMEKLAVGPEAAHVVELDRPVKDNVRAVAAVKDVAVSELVVAVLNRARHRDLVQEIRDAGARVHLIEGGEIAAAIAVARPEGPVDLMMGTGGAAEGVLAAAALTCLGGALQGRLRPDVTGPGAALRGPGFGQVLHTADLVRGDNIVFCATGITGNELLHGVQHEPDHTITHSVVLCSNPETVRVVTAEHPHDGRRATQAAHDEEHRSA